VGQTHSKWSPVATASYLLAPEIKIIDTDFFVDEKAEELKKLCPTKVFDIEDSTAVVKNERNCTMCRECLRHDNWEEKISIKKVKDHFICKKK
jgi:DNA-directed RNA polymerases I and III subunit RPAC1